MKRSLLSLASSWGTSAVEKTQSFPCDRYLNPFDTACFRAVSVQAPCAIVFRWLCQLRTAPYSYDWIDNYGQRSPRKLTPGLDQLEVGQRVMTIFQLIEFVPDRHLTLRLRSTRARARFGEIVCSYMLIPQGNTRCRLVAKLLVRYPHGYTGSLMRLWLPWGDLLMMRKQLLTLKYLAEQQFREA